MPCQPLEHEQATERRPPNAELSSAACQIRASLIHTRRKMNKEPIHANSLDAGWAALSNGDWQRARTAFE